MRALFRRAEKFRISQLRTSWRIPLSSPAAAPIRHAGHLDDDFTFHWCVLEGADFDFRPHPDDSGLRVKRDDLPTILRRTYSLHRMFEQFDPRFRTSNDGHVVSIA